MPIENIPISNLAYSTERPVAWSITKDLMTFMGLPNNIKIRYFGEENKAPQWNSRITPDGLSSVLWANSENIQVEVEEEVYMDDFWALNPRSQEYQPIFHDESIKFIMRPIYSTQQITIKFTYTSTDLNKANKWRNSMQMKIVSLAEVLVHDVSYHYEIPKPLLRLVEHIHNLKETIAGDGLSLTNYIKNCFTSKISELTTQTGSASSLVIPETQAGVLGGFEFEGVPDKPERSGESAAHTVNVSYKVIYSKPISIMCAYPLLVHQQLIDERFRASGVSYDLEGKLILRSATNGALNHFNQNIMDNNTGDKDILRVPEFDDTVLRRTIPGTIMVFSGMVALTDTNQYKFMNLNELGDYTFNKCVMDYIVKNHQTVTTLGGGMVYITGYKDGGMLPQESIYIDSNMNVMFKDKPSLKSVYHITVNIVVDFNKYNQRALIGLKTHKCFLYFVKLIERLVRLRGTDPLVGKVKLTDNDYLKLGLGKKYGPYGGSAFLNKDVGKDPNTGALSSIFIRNGSIGIVAMKN